MIAKQVDITLNIDGTSTVTNFKKGEAPILIYKELSSTVFNVTFPEKFRKGYKYSCCADGWDKQFILSGINEKGVVKFILPEVKKDTVKLGFCAYLEEQDKITKYVKWQGVQCTIINGGNNYGNL